MQYEEQLKLQAYLDGELPADDAREMANLLARDQGAMALFTELRNTRQAVAGFEKTIRLPESREFYWSKIQRQIEHLDLPARAPARPGFMTRLRRFLVPATAVALLAVAGFIATRSTDGSRYGIETSLSDPGAFTYRDFASGTTLVWLSYPPAKEVAESDEVGTLP